MKKTILASVVALSALLADAPGATAQWTDLGLGTPGTGGVPRLQASKARFGRVLHLRLSRARAGAPVWFGVGLTRIDAPVLGGILVPFPDLIFPVTADAAGNARFVLPVPNICVPDVEVYLQALVLDPVNPAGYAWSNALMGKVRKDVGPDFNGDGYGDVAIGAPNEAISGNANAGVVNVLYGRPNGLPAVSTVVRQGASLPGGTVSGTPDADDHFGTSIAIGDFNGDGYDDLAVGSPQESVPGITECGIVSIIYGSSQGLQGADDILLRQGQNGLRDSSEAFDWFGKSLTSGDFNGDGYDDVAMSAPYENQARVNQGIVQIVFGSATGITTLGDVVVTRIGADGDRFGWTLTSGDYDRNGHCDLAVGNPYVDSLGRKNAGEVTVYSYGPGAGATVSLRQGGLLRGVQIRGLAEQFDCFGFSAASADLNGDGADDLVIGSPFENINSTAGAGAISVIFGAPGVGLIANGNQLWRQGANGILGTPGLAEYYGYSIAAGDFNDDGLFDLAVGIPQERLTTFDAGAVNVIYSQAGVGPAAAGNAIWHQDVAGIVNVAGDGDQFGWSVATVDVDGDCFHDLIVGVPGEDINGRNDAGAVNLLYGGGGGLGANRNELWRQRTPEQGDRLGASTAQANDQRPLP